jgi:sugar/nucleoside kinase (ribokinase family)
MLECLFIGSTTKDMMLMVEAPPASDQRIAAKDILECCGGIAGVAASAFQKLGGQAGLITAVGEASETTDFIIEHLSQKKFKYTDVIRIDKKASPFSVIQVESDGKRCITHYGGCIKCLTLDSLDKEAVKSAKIVHMGGLDEEFCADLAKWCKENTDTIVSVDGGNLSMKGTDKILEYTDIFIPDDKTVAKTLGISPKEACRYYSEKGVKISCVTLGDKGSIAYSDGKYYFADPVKINAVDTTGAGDNFHGAFLYCYTQKWDMDYTLRFCNTFSALTCLGMGGMTAQPTLEETIRKMEE